MMRPLHKTRLLLRFVVCAATFSHAFAQTHSAPTKMQQALAYEKQGDFSAAEKIWSEFATDNPRNSDAWAHLGLIRALEGNYPEAVIAYREALQLHSHLPGLEVDLGLALFKQQKLEEAVQPLQAAVAESPNEIKPKLLLAMSYYGLGKYVEVVPYLTAAVNSSPENLQLRMTLAQSCLWAEQYQCTLDQFQEIVRLSPESAQADMLAGEALDGLNKTEEAIKQFREAEKASPNEPDVHFGLGYLLWKEHKFDEAREELKLELKDDPNHAQALTYLADIAIKQNDNSAARSYLQRAFLQPKVIRLSYLDMGILDAAAGANEQAKTNFLRAIEMDPAQKDAHWRLAHLYLSMGQRKEAQAEFAKMNELEQKDRDTVARQMAPKMQ
jgi:tetratricopeptide (TPR) repeat protein